MDLIIRDSARHIRVAVKKTIGITYKVMEKKQGLQAFNIPIRELSNSLKCLRTVLHEFYCRNTAVPRQAMAVAGALLDVKSLLHEINKFFEISPSKLQDVVKSQDQLYEYQRRILEKILVFQNASLSGELTMTQSLLLTVGILSPQMPSFQSDSNEEQQQQQLKERTIPDCFQRGSDTLLFMTSPVEEGLFVGYYTYNDESIIGGAGSSRVILRFDLKVEVLREQEESSDLTGHFKVEMGQFDNELQTASLRNYSFAMAYKSSHFPWEDPKDRRRRLCVQKWQFGGQWRDQSLDMNCADCLGNFLLDELDRGLTLDGEWYGFYFMGAETEPTDQPFHLKMQTIRAPEGVLLVRGEGTDEHGMFDIRGHLFRDALLKKLEFRKDYFSYDSDGTRLYRFGWDYKGLVEAGGRGVTGTWGVGTVPEGTFSMARMD